MLSVTMNGRTKYLSGCYFLQHAISRWRNSLLGCRGASVSQWTYNGSHQRRTNDMLTYRGCKRDAVYQIEPVLGNAHFKHGSRVGGLEERLKQPAEIYL